MEESELVTKNSKEAIKREQNRIRQKKYRERHKDKKVASGSQKHPKHNTFNRVRKWRCQPGNAQKERLRDVERKKRKKEYEEKWHGVLETNDTTTEKQKTVVDICEENESLKSKFIGAMCLYEKIVLYAISKNDLMTKSKHTTVKSCVENTLKLMKALNLPEESLKIIINLIHRLLDQGFILSDGNCSYFHTSH